MKLNVLWIIDKSVAWAWNVNANDFIKNLSQHTHTCMFTYPKTAEFLEAELQRLVPQADIVYCYLPYIPKLLKKLKLPTHNVIFALGGHRSFISTEA